MTVGKKIRAIRKSLKQTQKQLAKASGIGLNSIIRYEKGLRDPTISQLQRIAQGLGVPLVELLPEKDYGKTWLAYPAPPEEAFEQHQRATMARLRPCRECTYFSDNLLEHGTKPEDKVHWCDRYEIVLDGSCTCSTFRRYRDEKEGCQNV